VKLYKKYKRKIIRRLKRGGLRVVSEVMALVLPVKNKKVCFISDVRAELGGNLKCVFDYLEGKEYERVLALKADRRINRTMKEKFRMAYDLVTSKYILMEDVTDAITYTKFRKNQELVQLWHGPGAFKKFGHSRVANGEQMGKIHEGYKKYTKASVSGEGIRWCYAEAFGISEDKIKATGFPRTDVFFDEKYLENIKDKFYKEYPEMKDKKMILFAPTYRGSNIHNANYDFSQLDWDAIYKKYHEEYVFVVKWHPALYNNLDRGKVKGPEFSKYDGFYRDFSFYRDINELLVVCDTLVTDYSSLIFDYVLLNKPIMYFAYDLDEYAGYGGRGMYFEFDEYVYGSVAKNQDEFMKALDNKDLMEDKRRVFYEKFMGECDGHSTEKTCKWIFGE